MMTQVNEEGLSTVSMEAIIDYRKYDAFDVPKHGMYVATLQVQKKTRNMTVGWSLRVKWAMTQNCGYT